MKASLPKATSKSSNRALHSNEASYEVLFYFLYPLLKRFCFRILKSNELAEEVAGDVMMALWLKEQQWVKISNWQAYAFVAAKNRSLTILKREIQKRNIRLDDTHVDMLQDNTTPEQILIKAELLKCLKNAVESLPPRCKAVFQLVKENDLSYKEVSRILKVSTKTVDAHLVVGMKKLSQALTKDFRVA